MSAEASVREPLRWVPLREVTTVVMGQSPPSSAYNANGDGLPFFQGKAEFGAMYPTVAKWCSAPAKIAERNDVLMSVRAPVGPTNLATERCCIGRGLAAIRPNPGVRSKWLLYAFRSMEKAIDDLGTGTTFKAISGDTLRHLKVPVADPGHQDRVLADIEKQFSRLDEAVANLKRVRANLKRYKAAVLKAAVEGRLVPTEAELARREGRRYETGAQLLQRILETRRSLWKGKHKEPVPPDTVGLPILPAGWTWTSLDSLSWDSGYGTSEKCTYENSGPAVLRIPNVKNGMLDLQDLKYAPTDFALSSADAIDEGDMLVIRTNGSKSLIGRAAVALSKPANAIAFASYLIRFRLARTEKLPAWVSLVWQTNRIRSWIESRAATSAGQHNISQSVLATAAISVPPYAEQHHIVAEVDRRLSVVREVEAEVESNLKRADSLRQAVLGSAFVKH